MKLFVIQPHSIIDIITNSSSELFIFKGKEKKIIENMLKEIYPNYLNEYEPLLHISEMSAGDLNNFLYYHCNATHWPTEGKYEYPLIGDFTFDELYEQDGDIPAWNGQIQYKLRRKQVSKEIKVKKFHDYNKEIDPYGEENWNEEEDDELWWVNRFVTDENKKEFIKRIDPDQTMYFLYSRGENPKWEKQEKLMKVGTRYHLG
jgi:hypothetical protein